MSIQDAVVAVTMVECSMQGSALLGGINVLHSAFPSDVESEYAIQGSGSTVTVGPLKSILHGPSV